MKFLIILILFYLLGNAYVFHHLWVAMPPSTPGKIGIITFATIVILSLFLFFFAENSLPIGFAQFLYVIGTSWVFILIYFVIVFLVKDLIWLINHFLHFMPNDAITRYTRDNWVGLIFMVGFITMLMICGYLKYRWKVRTEIPIEVNKPLIGKDSLKIVGISDLHLGYTVGKKEFEKWVDLINAENPDLVIIAGDIVDNGTRPLIEWDIASSFRKIEAPIYTCLGNHEYISGIQESLGFIEESEIHLLRDSYIEIDSCLYIVGRDDITNKRRKSIEELTTNLDKSKPVIMLDHQPFHLAETEQAGIDIQFSGHTHRGQVWPISRITDAIYEVSHGHKRKGNSHIIVSSGIGLWGGKFRIGTQSEYVVITLKGQG